MDLHQFGSLSPQQQQELLQLLQNQKNQPNISSQPQPQQPQQPNAPSSQPPQNPPPLPSLVQQFERFQDRQFMQFLQFQRFLHQLRIQSLRQQPQQQDPPRETTRSSNQLSSRQEQRPRQEMSQAFPPVQAGTQPQPQAPIQQPQGFQQPQAPIQQQSRGTHVPRGIQQPQNCSPHAFLPPLPSHVKNPPPKSKSHLQQLQDPTTGASTTQLYKENTFPQNPGQDSEKKYRPPSASSEKSDDAALIAGMRVVVKEE